MSEVLRELVVALSLDSDNFSRNLRTINKQIKEAESTFNLAGAGIDNFEKSVKGAESKLSMLGTKLTQQNKAVEQYSRALVQANQKLTDSYATQEKLKSSLTGARSEYERIGNEVKSATTKYREFSSTLGESGSATIAAKQNMEQLKEEHKAAGAEVKKLEGQITANSKTLQNNADRIATTKTNLNNAKAVVKETEAEIKKFTQELYRMQSKWTQAGEALTAFSKKCDTIGKTVARMGRSMTLYVTTPILGLATAAIKASIDFESAFASVRKTVDATEAEYAELSESIRKMSTEVATSSEEIAEVMAVAGQLGIQNDFLTEFTKTMVDLGKSTDIIASESAASLAKFANITQMDQSLFQNLGSTLVDLGNNFAATESSIVQMALRLAGAGHQVGLTESQILGFATALSAVGIEAQMGGSAFSKTLVKMEVAAETGGDALKDFARVSGMTAEQFKVLWQQDAAAAFQAFIVGLSELDDDGESAIATLQEIGIVEVRLRDTLLRSTNATELFARAQVTANRAWEENTALVVEANKRYNTTESKLENLKNTAILFGQRIGDDLNPTIQNLIEKANEMLATFLAMDQSQRMAIVRFAGIAAAAGPALLIIGKTVSAVGKVTAVLGKVSTGMGKFSAAVKTAGGGFGGFAKTVLSSKLAVAALSAALIYGAYQLYDYASGAKATREALQGMNDTAKEWKNNAADTFYSKSGLTYFGMSADDFVRTTASAEAWLTGLLEVWSDGKKETDDILDTWLGSFKSLTASTRDALEGMKVTADDAGLATISEQLNTDLAQLDTLDKEIESLLKRRQNRNFTDKDKVRLRELIDTREAIEVKYKLTAADTGGFDTILTKLEAEVARAQAKGQGDAAASVYESAMVASAEGMAAVKTALDERYDKEFALIQLMEDSVEKQQALSDLNAQYMLDRKAAAEEYAAALAQIVLPVWNQYDIQAAGDSLDILYAKLREYSIEAANGDKLGMARVLEEMNALTAGMDETALTEYISVLTQIQSLLDSGMSVAQVDALFPDIDLSGQMEEIAALTQFVRDHQNTLSGLNTILTDAMPEEVLKIATDLDMTGAQARWDAFAANPGVITAEAVIDSYQEAEDAIKLQPILTAFIEQYTEVPEGASTAALTPEGLVAYVAKYAEVVTGTDVSELTPENVTAMVSAYQELANGADINLLKPADITAFISSYMEENAVDTTGLSPDGITAFVLAYEEVTGGANTASLNPTDIAAMVTEYLQAENIDVSSLTNPQIAALVTAYAQATNVDQTELHAELIAQITAYEEQAGITKPSYIESTIGIVGYDLEAYNAFVKDNPVELTGIVRVGEQYDNPSDVINDPAAVFWEGGTEIPVNLVPANLIDADTLIAYDADGTLHVLITPDIRGTTESVKQAASQMTEKYVTTSVFGNTAKNDWGFVNDMLGGSLLDWMNSFNGELKAFEQNKGTWVTLWGLLDGMTLSGIDMRMDDQFSGDTMANFTAYVSEMVAAIQNGTEVSQDDLNNLEAIVDFLNTLKLTETGENIRAGVAQGMTEAGWTTDAESVASSLEDALNLALGIQSPSERMKPIGENAAAGVGVGLNEYDAATDATTFAANLLLAMETVLYSDLLTLTGQQLITGLALAMTSFGMSTTANTIANNVKTALSATFTNRSLRTVGVHAMLGLAEGINAARSGVIAAMKSAARAAVAAAKSELKIQSPSAVFRDEVGRMAMRGFGRGVLLESKEQAKIVANAARYLTGAAQTGSVVTNQSDNSRMYNQQSSVNLSGNSFYIQDEQDIRSLAIEIAALTKRQQRGRGLRMA